MTTDESEPAPEPAPEPVHFGPLLLREDYNPAAPPGKGGYDHAGRYCKICGRQTSFFRDHKASGLMHCTRCGVIESIGGIDVHVLIALVVGIIKAIELDVVDSRRSRVFLKYAMILDGACRLREVEAGQ